MIPIRFDHTMEGQENHVGAGFKPALWTASHPFQEQDMLPIHIDHTLEGPVGAGFKPAHRTAIHREEQERSTVHEH